MTASPSSQALMLKHSSDTALMPPPPPPKRIKRPAKILDEDIYTSSLSHIIARDFFPGLLETQIKQEYLDALDSKDKDWIASARKKLDEVLTAEASSRSGTRHPDQSKRRYRQTGLDPVSSPLRQHNGGAEAAVLTDTPGSTTTAAIACDTPVSVISAQTATTTASTQQQQQENSKGEIPDVSNLGLLAFQARYTSEDNESFNKLLDKQNAKRREKHAWLWSGNNKIPSARQIAHRRREAKRIADSGCGEGSSNSIDKQLVIKTDLDARPAAPDTWHAQPDNTLMFIPSSIEDSLETVQQRAEAASRAAPKQTVYHNTRLPPPPSAADHAGSSGPVVPPSPSLSAIQDAIAGRPRRTESDADYSLAGRETPRVNGYAFVDEDDDNDGNGRTSDGQLGQETPSSEDLFDLRLFSSGDPTPNPFNIKENRRRELLHHRMVDRVARKKRAEKLANTERILTTPAHVSELNFGLRPHTQTEMHTHAHIHTLAQSSGLVRSLTPAAQKLFSRVGTTPRRGIGTGAGTSSTKKNMWTPSRRKR